MTELLINEFIIQNKNLFSFNISTQQKEDISSICTNIILNYKCHSIENLASVLECLKILARDVSIKQYLCKEDIWNTLFEISGILQYSQNKNSAVFLINQSPIIVENSLKVLCNMTKNFYITIPTNLRETSVTGILNRVQFYDQNIAEITLNIKIFEMKLLFLLTALFPETRCSAIRNNDCLHRLTSVFKSQIAMIKDITTDDVGLDCEILKCLFNVLYQSIDEEMMKEVEKDMHSLLDYLKELVVEINLKSLPENVKIELLSNTANLLTSVPDSCFQYLLFQTNEESEKNLYKDVEAVRFIQLILNLIERRLNENTNLLETLSPLMHAMGKACLVERNIRKYCRLKVLPYMKKEVMELPEHGNSIRNKLCKLLQHPCEQVTESVAFFLFILCKEDVERAIKYTGFGNFAGFLARHALLTGSKSNKDVNYSDSEDSDTEEYLNVKDKVNPVTGRVEENPTNPLEGMSEEQKEYEVVQLMNQIDLLQKQGIIKPGIIGDDGNVRAAESVLEVLEKAVAETNYKESVDSDDDSKADSL